MSTASRRQLGPNEHFCNSCGEVIKKAAEICPKCGVRIKEPSAITSEKKKGSKFKTFFLSIIGISVLLIVVVGLLPSEGQEETIDDKTEAVAAATATPEPTAVPKPTAIPTNFETKYGITNVTRATRICREYVAMINGVQDGTHTSEESRDLMKKMYGLADATIASSLRTPTRNMLSAWTQGDQEGWLVAIESLAPICVDVFAS
jgi:hypothetical protein